MSELIIKIGADNKEAKDKINEIQKEAEDLEGKLGTVAKISGAAFLGLTAAIGTTVHAYAESEKATKELNLALQNQGIFTEELAESYKKYAEEVQLATGIDDDAIVAAQAKLQSFIGMNEITPQLTQAIADLSIKTGDTSSAAEILGRSIQGNVRGLKQFGIVIEDNLSTEERQNQILLQISQKFGGLAVEANKGLGGVKGLTDAFSSFQEEIGKRFAPIVTFGIQKITEFLRAIAKNEPLLDMIEAILKIGVVLTGIITVLATGAIAFVKISSAIQIATAAMGALGLSTQILVGATGIGLLLIIATEVYLNWNKIWPAMQSVYQTFVNNVSQIASALGDILLGAFNPITNLNRLKSGIAQLKSIITTGYEDMGKAIDSANQTSETKAVKQDAAKLARAREANSKLIEEEQIKHDIVLAKEELASLQLEQASKSRIDLKTAEIELLKALQQADQDSQIEFLNQSIADNAVLQEQARLDEIERDKILKDTILAQDANYRNLTIEQQRAYFLNRKKQLEDSIATEASTRAAAIDKAVKEETKKSNMIIQDRVQFGVAYSAINATINRDEINATQTAATEIAKLQSSKNNTLKQIGKAAAITQIGIDSAKGAMAAYANMQIAIPFPPVSIPLGIAAAAGVLAYGGERIASVVAAADGGIIPGFNKGGDSVSSFLQPGELVVPRSNFDEVVNAVAAQRSSANDATSVTGQPGSNGSVMVDLQFSGDNAEKFLTARQVEARSLGTLRESTA
jgi:hypothetical protein